MYDETQNRIINETMRLVMEKGYSATTTKDIAKAAGINECTIFRKFRGKKDIILSAMELSEWNPKLTEEDFMFTDNLREDLIQFSRVYMRKVTPQMVRVSIGLRIPELAGDTMDGIMKVPQVFKTVLMKRFAESIHKGMISCGENI